MEYRYLRMNLYTSDASADTSEDSGYRLIIEKGVLMIKYRLENYIEDLKETKRLALERENKKDDLDFFKGDSGSEESSLDKIAEERKHDNLLNFLKTRDFDTIKVIQAVMYIGRDYRMDDREDSLRSFAAPDDILNQWINDITFKDKEIEIEQIYEKIPLGSYLARAFEILKID